LKYHSSYSDNKLHHKTQTYCSLF